jgi:transcriptional regulator with XRE-family HTH domain
MDEVAQEVRRSRELLGLTQQGLADALGVSSKTVSTWETGKNTPTYGHLRRIRALAAGEQPEEALRERVDRLASLVEQLTISVLELDAELKRSRREAR